MKSKIVGGAFLLCIGCAATCTAGGIKVDGRLMDWGAAQPAKDGHERTHPCDWREVYAKVDAGQFFVAYRCESPVNFDVAAAYSIFIDTDGDRKTGFRGGADDFPIGADYLLQGSTLYLYNQNEGQNPGIDWYWTEIGPVECKVDSDVGELAFPVSKLDGAKKQVTMFFYADNTAKGVGGDAVDVVPDGALRVGGGGRFLTVKLGGGADVPAQKPSH